MQFEKSESVPVSQFKEGEVKKVERRQIFNNEDRELLREAADNFIDQAHEQRFDSLVFLDRSARIFAHLISERWKARYPSEQAPEIHFMKVGQEMGTRSQKSGVFMGYYNNSPEQEQEYVKQLRKTFRIPGGQNSFFAGKKVLIVDEYTWSGLTLSFAEELFKKAFANEVDKIGVGSLWGSGYGSKNVTPVHTEGDRVPLSKLPQAPIAETRDEVISHTKRELFPKKITDIEKRVKRKKIRNLLTHIIPFEGDFERRSRIHNINRLEEEKQQYDEQLQQVPRQTRNYMAAVKEIREIAKEKVPDTNEL